MRARSGDLYHAARDLREGVERTHQTGSRAAFYHSVWSGIEILSALDHCEQAAVFDGMATGFSVAFRAVAASARQRAAIAHACATYGQQHYDAAFETGAAMTYDQAVEHTLRVLDELIAETSDTSDT